MLLLPSPFRAMFSMSCDEIFEKDAYTENGVEHHEVKEIIEAFLGLPDISST